MNQIILNLETVLHTGTCVLYHQWPEAPFSLVLPIQDQISCEEQPHTLGYKLLSLNHGHKLYFPGSGPSPL